MTSLKLLSLSLIATAIFAAPVVSSANSLSRQKNLSDDIDSLGGNQELMEMAQNIKSQTRTRIVQDRLVQRRHRVEFGLSYGSTFGGDAYVKTQSLGLSVDYHLTPRWSFGARYYDYGNSLTNEGNRIFEQARRNYEAGGRAYAVDIDYPEQAAMVLLNWYPIYGKTSFLDMGVTQFDLYLLGGGGQITLSSGSTSLLTAGAGVGAWISKNLSARAEVRYQNYKDQPLTGARSLDTVVGSLGLGWFL